MSFTPGFQVFAYPTNADYCTGTHHCVAHQPMVSAPCRCHPAAPQLPAAFCSYDRLWPAGFTSEWEDEKGVRFINSITETPQGPIFR